MGKGFLDYIRGFMEIVSTHTPRYSYVLKNIDIIYPNYTMTAQATYIPVGCHRQFVDKISHLNTEDVCYQFKPEHARIIVGINTLEYCLDLKIKEHAEIYLDFVKLCISKL